MIDVVARLDVHTLWHHHGVILEHVDDLQVAIGHSTPTAEHLYVGWKLVVPIGTHTDVPS